MSHDDFQLHAVSITNHTDSGRVEITWSDGLAMAFEHVFLRTHCKCADCTAANALPTYGPSLRLSDIRPVGSYGIQLVFNDGHDRGIYPWPYLYELGTDQQQ